MIANHMNFFQAAAAFVLGGVLVGSLFAQSAVSPALVKPSSGASAVQEAQSRDGSLIRIETLSSRPNLISGESVLVQVTYGPSQLSPLRLTLNNQDVTQKFQRAKQANTIIGLVDGLHAGQNTLRAESGTSPKTSQSLQLTSYPIEGPILSGPQLLPYRCMTDKFMLPDGSYLGPSTDSQCSAPTKVQYVYMSSDGNFVPMRDLTHLPQDVAMTTTVAGLTVPYIVRFEAGTIDRGVYNIAVLHNPIQEAAPTPPMPPRAWNRKLIWVHGFGCPGGWYYQGTETGTTDGYDVKKVSAGGDGILPRTHGLNSDFSVLSDEWLSKGFAVATSTLNHPSINCNPHLAGEATGMIKEHFIKEFGPPFYTVSTGGSGGAYSSEQIADAFPGLFDGILIHGIFPDSISIGLSGLDGHLLTHYFAVTNPTGFTQSQQVAVSGYEGMQAFLNAANQAGRTDPVPQRADIPGYVSAAWYSLGGAWPILHPTPEVQRYDPVSNPTGARPTIFDVSIAIYGKDQKTGFALRPFDNVGVQYGLAALNDGSINVAQFLDLNERIGGYDHDANYVTERSAADLGAIKRAYQSGLLLSGGGGLSSIPIFDYGSYNESCCYHYQWFHFALRERLMQANGGAENLVMWRGPEVSNALAANLLDRWITDYKMDSSNLPQREKVIQHKPATAIDGCWTAVDKFIPEPQTFGARPTSRCNKLFPSYAAPRLVAGESVAGNVLRCQLKPIQPSDYQVRFTQAELSRLHRIFPDGVCDWTRPGVNQVPVVPWASFGPSPDNLIFDVTAKERALLH